MVGPQHDTEALEDRALCRTVYEGRVPYVLLEYARLDMLLFVSVMSLARGSRFWCGPLIGKNMHTVGVDALFPSKKQVSM
jgi:hypothetical protein